ncbi:hypothetical protein GDO86_003482 [Hymenochirus boettgeri]|uniref:G-patch domain-containing protein n=1 Tax=Hymenochirus boettgeri TaxID=247094 RepID=A0A8T2K1N0_9PIPI|nr:hypothetical protein GDO86_003482 [Hymenochirus boettgeri]
MSEAGCAPVLFVVGGIPSTFRSAQLRNYFSQFTESDGFVCFHYRHRPETRSGATGTRCCPVTVKPERAGSFLRMYHMKPWIDCAGNQLPGRCLIRRVRKGPLEDKDNFPYKTRRELCEARDSKLKEEQLVTATELQKMPEMNPPAMMPQGNVGTPLAVFLQLIRSCSLPPKIITKLGLRFPSNGRRYSRVPFSYSGTKTLKTEGVYTASGQELTECASITDAENRTKEEKEDLSDSDDDDDTCEEWERHEALHEDVTTQERIKERLYEEEIELKWEKGGSGLVFYTDAQFWQEKEGDFDEQTADDWDVDMMGYYEDGGGDKDARDYLKMRIETKRRDGLDTIEYSLGAFEKHTKGIGHRVMKRQGWTEGKGLGANGEGVPDALENEGQNPKCKRGLGYHGEKLQTWGIHC